MREEIIPIAACPGCKGKLSMRDNSGFYCGHCSRQYEIISGVPILLTQEKKKAIKDLLSGDQSLSMVKEYSGTPGFLDAMPKKAGYLSLMLNSGAHRRKHIRKRLYGSGGDKTLILSVGGGPTRDDPREINLNIGIFPNVDVVGDGYELPFLDDSFDSVVSKAVFEHVESPEKIISEMRRVLKPRGYAYIEAPFLFMYHSYPADYHRFTLPGVEKLCSVFSKEESGIIYGPTSAMLELMNAYWGFLLAPRNKYLRKAVSGIFKALFSPFKYIDLLLNKREGAHKIAGGFYFLGRKG